MVFPQTRNLNLKENTIHPKATFSKVHDQYSSKLSKQDKKQEKPEKLLRPEETKKTW